MGRLIINNKSSAPDDEALAVVMDCIHAGRISNDGKQYSYASKYDINGKKVVLLSTRNPGSDSFSLIDDNSVLAP